MNDVLFKILGFCFFLGFFLFFPPNGCTAFWNETLHLSPHDMVHLYTMCEFAYVWFVQ